MLTPQSTDDIATRVLEALVSLGRVTPEQVLEARDGASSDAEAGRRLLASGFLSKAQLGAVLENEVGFPSVDLASYAPDSEAMVLVPEEMARQFNVVPLFEIEGALTIAIGDPGDVFVLDEIAARLGYSLDAVLSDSAAVEAAIEHYYYEAARAPEVELEPVAMAEPELPAAPAATVETESTAPVDVAPAPALPATEEPEEAHAAQTVEEVVAAAPPAESAAIDLDVLAVSDGRTAAVLVAEILERAVQQGANRIHLLPYKNDFFLVFRIKGRLEKVASAPLSMQQQLVDGFKNLAKLGAVAPNVPAVGRVHAEIDGKQLVLTLSSVPTVAGQRLVITLAPVKPAPSDLRALGMSEPETRALQAMVERGRGLLLVAAPVTGGRSTTYYALLEHAARVGKTVYSVERSIQYEIPAVAQVLVGPEQPNGASGYLAAGMKQDTDVLALDSLQSVEDVHLAIEAAGMGKLVVATYAGSDIAAAVRRLLDLGAEPYSLANALTLGVGQRIVRKNCPHCATTVSSPLVARIPGADPSMPVRRGAGCPNCGNTGFAGATGIFEVLPFTEPVRAAIARGGTVEQISAAATAAGMRPLIASGLGKVAEGTVSPDELDRVLRFAQ